MTKQPRQLTKLEEKIIRLYHHDHLGLSLETVATICKTNTIRLEAMLNAIEQKAPQLFPILTKQQQAILHLYDKHTSRKAVAAALDLTERELNEDITFLHKHGFLHSHKIKRYDPSMDRNVKERF